MSAAGCYDLALSCDGPDCLERHRAAGENVFGPLEQNFNHEFGSKCRADARRAGWKWNEVDGWAYCKLCRNQAPKKSR
jgi:hypothetical protein